MTPGQARELSAEAQAVSKRARDLAAGMDATTLLRRPPVGGWSVAENVQHLILTAGAMLPLAEGAVVELERRGAKTHAPSSLGLMGFLLVKSMEPPSRMKSKTTPSFEPASVGDASTLFDRFQATIQTLESVVARATGLPTAKVKVASPFNPRIKYNLYAALRIVLAHTRRHLWQAEEVKRHLET